MANNENRALVVKYLPQIIVAIKNWWQRRRERKAGIDHAFARRVYSDGTTCGVSCGRCGGARDEHGRDDGDVVDVGDPRQSVWHPDHDAWLRESSISLDEAAKG